MSFVYQLTPEDRTVKCEIVDRCSVNKAKEVYDMLDKKHKIMLKESCFGHLIDLKGLKTQQIVHHMIMRLVHPIVRDFNNSLVEDPLGLDVFWFKVGCKKIRFGPQEFALVSGLKLGNDKNYNYEPTNYVLLDKYFKNRRAVYRKDVWQKFKSTKNASDRFKLGLIVILTYVVWASEEKIYVDPWVFSIVEYMNVFNDYPWGNKSYESTVYILRRGLDDVLKKKIARTYSLYGFSHAFKVWALEAIPSLGQFSKIVDKDALPRILRWGGANRVISANVEVVLQLKKVVAFRKLVATEEEKKKPYFLMPPAEEADEDCDDEADEDEEVSVSEEKKRTSEELLKLTEENKSLCALVDTLRRKVEFLEGRLSGACEICKNNGINPIEKKVAEEVKETKEDENVEAKGEERKKENENEEEMTEIEEEMTGNEASQMEDMVAKKVGEEVKETEEDKNVEAKGEKRKRDNENEEEMIEIEEEMTGNEASQMEDMVAFIVKGFMQDAALVDEKVEGTRNGEGNCVVVQETHQAVGEKLEEKFEEKVVENAEEKVGEIVEEKVEVVVSDDDSDASKEVGSDDDSDASKEVGKAEPNEVPRTRKRKATSRQPYIQVSKKMRVNHYDPFREIDPELMKAVDKFLDSCGNSEIVTLRYSDIQANKLKEIVQGNSLSDQVLNDALCEVRRQRILYPKLFDKDARVLDSYFIKHVQEFHEKNKGNLHKARFTKLFKNYVRGVVPDDSQPLEGCKTLYVPVLEQEHWILLKIDLDKRMIYVYDSLPGHVRFARIFIRVFTPLQLVIPHLIQKHVKGYETYCTRKLSVNRLKCPAQENGSDCGMFVLKYVQFMLGRLDVRLIQNARMPSWRKRLVAELLAWEFQP